MSAVITAPAAGLDSFVGASLAKLAASLVRPAMTRIEPMHANGLSVADIADASRRATRKGGLTIRRPAYAR